MWFLYKPSELPDIYQADILCACTHFNFHSSTGVNSGANGCVHEDGGKNAIFEQITVDEQVRAFHAFFCLHL